MEQKDSKNTTFFTSPNNKNSSNYLALKDTDGRYLVYAGTTPDSLLDDLLNNGEDFCEAERYEESLACYISALSKPDLRHDERWNVLVNCAVPLVRLRRYEEALTKLAEAMENLQANQMVDSYGWIVEARKKDILQTMAGLEVRNIPK